MKIVVYIDNLASEIHLLADAVPRIDEELSILLGVVLAEHNISPELVLSNPSRLSDFQIKLRITMVHWSVEQNSPSPTLSAWVAGEIIDDDLDDDEFKRLAEAITQ